MSHAEFYIQQYGLVLREQAPGTFRIEQAAGRWKDPDLENIIREHRQAICEALQRRVVPFECSRRPAGVKELDPWRHAENGIMRMIHARTKLDQWHAEGHTPRVRWQPSVAIVDAKTGKALAPASWMLMELLWLLRDHEPAPACSTPNPGPRQRGVA